MAVSLSKSPLDRRCPCSSLLQADDYDSTSTSWTRAKIQVDQMDDDHQSFGGSSSQNEVNENGEKVCKSRRSIILWSFIVSVLFHQLHSKPRRRVRKNPEQEHDPFFNSEIHYLKTGTRYSALGNGGLAVMCLLESRYQPDLSFANVEQLVIDAIMAGIRNDLGSGLQVESCILHPDGNSEYTRYELKKSCRNILRNK